MKWRKAKGSNGVVIHTEELAGEFGIDKNTELANRIYRIGQVLETMRESEFIVISKKKGAVEFSTHRTISIMNQIGTTILKVLFDRLKRKVEETLGDVQFVLGKEWAQETLRFC